MDAHPFHEPVHTWRDAFIHLAIVTVGLFIALMPYSEVQADADAYQLQSYISAQILNLTNKQAESLAPIAAGDDEQMATLPDAEYDSMIHDAAINGMDLHTLQQIMTGLDQNYINLLKAR